jgi:hypothetical protein
MRRIGIVLAMALVPLIIAAPASAAEDLGERMDTPLRGRARRDERPRDQPGLRRHDDRPQRRHIDPGAGCTALSANEVTYAKDRDLDRVQRVERFF